MKLSAPFGGYTKIPQGIQEGKVLPSMLLRKLTTYSRKNPLYQAFHALGTVKRTIFLLKFISDVKLREIIHRSTNKTEQYNNFEDWILFAYGNALLERASEEVEKRVKYTGVIANCVMLDNVIELNVALNTLAKEGSAYPNLSVHFSGLGVFAYPPIRTNLRAEQSTTRHKATGESSDASFCTTDE